RVLLKNKTFSLMAVATLAIAIGANTAIFSISRSVLLDPLPYRQASRLVIVWQDAPRLGFPKNTPAPADYSDWKSQKSASEGMAALRAACSSLTGGGDPPRLQGEQVTNDLFDVVGATPLRGRSFSTADDQPDSAKVAILSGELWKTRFGSQQN